MRSRAASRHAVPSRFTPKMLVLPTSRASLVSRPSSISAAAQSWRRASGNRSYWARNVSISASVNAAASVLVSPMVRRTPSGKP